MKQKPSKQPSSLSRSHSLTHNRKEHISNVLPIDLRAVSNAHTDHAEQQEIACELERRVVTVYDMELAM